MMLRLFVLNQEKTVVNRTATIEKKKSAGCHLPVALVKDRIMATNIKSSAHWGICFSFAAPCGRQPMAGAGGKFKSFLLERLP
jgi:hypothetical protein